MIIEIFVHLLTPYPFVDFGFQMILLGTEIYFRFMTFLYILSFFKVYTVFRLIGIYSRFTDSLSEKYCRSHGIGAGVLFAIKSTIKEAPFKTVMFFLISLTLLLGIIIRMLEVLDPNSRDKYSHFTNGFWQIIIALTTVGYGEIFPITHLGRFTVLLGVFLGTFLVSVTIVALTSVTTFSREELKAYLYLKGMLLKEKLKHEYHGFIIYSFRMYKIKKKLRDYKKIDRNTEYIVFRRKKMNHLQKIIELKRELNQETFVGEDDMFMEIQSRIEEEISLIKIGLKHVNKYKDTLAEQLRLQNEFIKKLKLNSLLFKKSIKNPLYNLIVNRSKKDELTVDSFKNKSKDETVETDNFYPKEFRPSLIYRKTTHNVATEEADYRANPNYDVFKSGSAEIFLSKIFDKDFEPPKEYTKNISRVEEQYENYYYQWASNESRAKLLNHSKKTTTYIDQLSTLYKKNNNIIDTIIHNKKNSGNNSPIPMKLDHDEFAEDGMEAVDLVKAISKQQKKIGHIIENMEVVHKQKKNKKKKKK